MFLWELGTTPTCERGCFFAGQCCNHVWFKTRPRSICVCNRQPNSKRESISCIIETFVYERTTYKVCKVFETSFESNSVRLKKTGVCGPLEETRFEFLTDGTYRLSMYMLFFAFVVSFAEGANNSRAERGTEGFTSCDSEAAHPLARVVWNSGSLICFFSSI